MNSGSASQSFAQQVIKARHDLRNPLAHILGFSEMLADHARKLSLDDLRTDSLAINSLAEQILAHVNQALDPPAVESGQSNFARLHEQVRTLANEILGLADGTTQRFAHRKDDVIHNDLARIAGSARQLMELADAILPRLLAVARKPGRD